MVVKDEPGELAFPEPSWLRQDEARIQKVTKRLHTLEEVNNNVKLLHEMLLHYSQEYSSEADKELMKVSCSELSSLLILLCPKWGTCPREDMLAFGGLVPWQQGWRSSVYFTQLTARNKCCMEGIKGSTFLGWWVGWLDWVFESFSV